MGGFLHLLREVAQQPLELLGGLALEGDHDREIEAVQAAQGLHVAAHARLGHVARARVEGGDAVVGDEPAEAGADDSQAWFLRRQHLFRFAAGEGDGGARPAGRGCHAFIQVLGGQDDAARVGYPAGRGELGVAVQPLGHRVGRTAGLDGGLIDNIQIGNEINGHFSLHEIGFRYEQMRQRVLGAAGSEPAARTMEFQLQEHLFAKMVIQQICSKRKRQFSERIREKWRSAAEWVADRDWLARLTCTIAVTCETGVMCVTGAGPSRTCRHWPGARSRWVETLAHGGGAGRHVFSIRSNCCSCPDAI